ncbi:MAG TPA: hypothetical protein PLZ52_07550 [Bacteroidales bacterium]|nr:hypothetical protein [Bacteroidales bacterium]HOE05056.1 hypothetical protein [Bacteroidales bacterium]HQL69509.1 hypothetical protein [Bacteroidales bacterium]
MASKKDLKQDINRLVNELVADCLQYMKSHPGKSESEIAGIISEALKLRKDLIHTINHIDASDEGKSVKSQYNTAICLLIEKVDAGYKSLSKLAH